MNNKSVKELQEFSRVGVMSGMSIIRYPDSTYRIIYSLEPYKDQTTFGYVLPARSKEPKSYKSIDSAFNDVTRIWGYVPRVVTIGTHEDPIAQHLEQTIFEPLENALDYDEFELQQYTEEEIIND